MSNATIEAPAAVAPPEPETKPKKPAKSAKRAKKAARKAKPADKKSAAKPTAKPTAERSNKKAEVIALMKRAKGATLGEIGGLTGWQNHTIRGFVSILGKKGEHNIESSKNDKGERTYRITK